MSRCGDARSLTSGINTTAAHASGIRGTIPTATVDNNGDRQVTIKATVADIARMTRSGLASAGTRLTKRPATPAVARSTSISAFVKDVRRGRLSCTELAIIKAIGGI